MFSVTSALPAGYKYLIEDEKFSSSTNFETSFRIRSLKTEEEAKRWIDTLNDLSLVTWKVLRTYPNSGKINIYKGEFRCQHRVHGKRMDLKKSKNTNCPARLRVCIRRYLKSTNAKSPDPLTKLWPCIVELKNTHNHAVESAASLQYRPVNEATRKKISDLFQLGHSPLTITELLRLDLLIESPESYEDRENDASYCPLPAFCYREYIRAFGHSYRGRLKNSLQAELESLLFPYINDAEGGRAIMSSVTDHLIVCIVTPIMQNILSLVTESRGTIHLNVYGHPDKKSRLYLFTTWIPIGQVPLGVMLSDTEDRDVFVTGLQLLKSILPSGSFFGSACPEVMVLTDENPRRKSALQQEFPSTLILTSKCYHLKLFHEHVTDPQMDPVIPKGSQVELYTKFKSMLNCRQGEFGPAFKTLTLSHRQPAPPRTGTLEFLTKMWSDTNGFAEVDRPGAYVSPPTPCPATDSVQILSRLLLTEVFDRVKGFNLVQLAHFVITTLEDFTRRRLTSPQYVESLLKIFLPGKASLNLHKVRRIESGFYEVPDDISSSFVDTDIIFCSCSNSRFCTHLAAVVHKYHSATISYPIHLQDFYFDLAGYSGVKGHQKSEALKPFLIPKTKRLGEPVLKKLEETITDSRTEGESLVKEISEWLRFHVTKQPTKFLPAMRSMVRKMDGMETDSEAIAAVAGFGFRPNPVRLLPSSPSLEPKEPGVVGVGEGNEPELEPVEVHVGVQPELSCGPEPGEAYETFIPLQEIQSEDGTPAYFILVTGDESDTKGLFGVESVIPGVDPEPVLVTTQVTTPRLPVSIVPRRKVTKKVTTSTYL